MLFFITIAGGSVYYAVFESSVFIVKEIEIQGLNLVEEEDILDYSDIKIGENLYKLRTGEIETRIKEHPYVRETKVKRKGFSGIKIVIREREEYAIIPYMGSFIYLDQEQVVLRVSDGLIDESLIIVTGVEFSSFRVGDPLQVKNESILESAYDILIAAQESEMMDRISEVHIADNRDVRLITFNGIEVLMGQVDQPAYSVLALKEALVTLHTRNLENVILDMRYDDHITVRPRARQEEVQ